MNRALLFRTMAIVVLLLANSFYCVSQNADYYNIAYSKIETMLEDSNHSFKEAVFTVENAYFDDDLDIEAIYKKIEKYADFCIGIKESGNICYDGKDQDRALNQYSVFAFMTEKIPIFNGEQIDTVYPFRYNYKDFSGRTDWANMFVSTLMHNKQGNCHSLPYLYKIIMDEIGEKAQLSLCPNHLYIKIRNDKAGWHNVELTNNNFPTDAYLMSSGYVHIDAIRNGIYMKALTDEQSVALCLIDLAQGYIAKFGLGNGEFVLKCCETALKYFPDCITAMLLKSRVLAESYKNSVTKSEKQFDELTELTTKMHKLGYRKMPDRMYQSLLSRIQSEAGGDLYGIAVANHLTAAEANTKNPFAEYGFDKSIMIRSANETVFEEFFDLEDTVELGGVYFNIRIHEIASFIPNEKLKNEIDVDLIALSVDPKAHLYWWITPYTYALNNPMKYVDPNGMEVIITGDAADAATNTLSTRNITVTRDAETGRLSAEGKAKNRDERLLIKAIECDKVTVNLTANNSNVIGMDENGREMVTNGGSFMGNTLGYNDKGKAVSASAEQYVSIDALNRNFDLSDHGAIITHEITEAHQGGRISIRRNEAAPMAAPGADRTIYNKAHNRASYQPLFKHEKTLPLTPVQQQVKDALRNIKF